MTDTRGPATGKVPPHVKDRLEAKRVKEDTRSRKGPVWARVPVLVAIAVLALAIGFGFGRGSVADADQAVADEIAASVLPLANEAEAIWRVGIQSEGAIADAALALEADDDPSAIAANIEAWSTEHQRLLTAFDAIELSAAARPLGDLFSAYVRAQLDGAVLLGAAASHEGSARQELFRAAVREIGRARTLLRQARVALENLGGPATPAIEVPTVPGLTRPGQPLPSPFAEPSTDEAATDDPSTEADSGTGASTDEPSPTPSPS